MTCWGRRSREISAVLALLIAACAPPREDAHVSARTLLPPDLALGFLQSIKSRTSPALFGSETVPPCQFTDKGAWSGGEYRRLTGQRGPSQVTGYEQWIVVRIDDPGGRELAPAELGTANAWKYWLRTPRTARTMFGTTDHCIVGPTTEPVRKLVEALVALGVALVPEYGYIVR
jgi:hypothetical protein